MKRRILPVAVVFATFFNLASVAFATDIGLSNFHKVKEYTDVTFTDVDSSVWYAEYVKSVYEFGLMNGNGNIFNPDGEITHAECIAIAARLHNIYYGGNGEFQQGSPWYQVYLDYAMHNSDMDEENYFIKYPTMKADRKGFASIITNLMPSEAFAPINNFKKGDLPDVHPNHDMIYTLYNAGILTGSDEYGSFLPDTTISRKEIATIITRAAIPSLRKEFTITPKQVEAMSVSLQYDTLEMSVGSTFALVATILPANATDKTVTWKTSNPSVATVSNSGVVTALKSGLATIYAYAASESLAAICVVSVSAPTQNEQPTIFPELSTKEAVIAYINNNYGHLETPMGTYNMVATIQENTSSIFPQDWYIQCDDPYSVEPWYDLKYSIAYSDEQKAQTIQIFRNYQLNIYDIIHQNFPDKKLLGGFYYGYYKYPYTRVGYESIRVLTWMNYTPDVIAGDYFSSNITSFHWVSTYDDYVFP